MLLEIYTCHEPFAGIPILLCSAYYEFACTVPFAAQKFVVGRITSSPRLSREVRLGLFDVSKFQASNCVETFKVSKFPSFKSSKVSKPLVNLIINLCVLKLLQL